MANMNLETSSFFVYYFYFPGQFFGSSLDSVLPDQNRFSDVCILSIIIQIRIFDFDIRHCCLVKAVVQFYLRPFHFRLFHHDWFSCLSIPLKILSYFKATQGSALIYAALNIVGSLLFK